MAALSVVTETSQFAASHGKAPRGYGYWILDLVISNGRGDYTTEQFGRSGTLTEVRRAAVAHVKATIGEAKSITVHVLP